MYGRQWLAGGMEEPSAQELALSITYKIGCRDCTILKALCQHHQGHPYYGELYQKVGFLLYKVVIVGCTKGEISIEL
jgi:hypothetical protein